MRVILIKDQGITRNKLLERLLTDFGKGHISDLTGHTIHEMKRSKFGRFYKCTGGSTIRELFFVENFFYEKILSISDKRGCSEKLNAWAIPD
jgi:hypothetical protein